MRPGRTGSESAAVTIIVIVLLFSGCRLDYDQAVLPEDLAEHTPETVLYNTSITLVRTDARYVVIEAERAESFPRQATQVLQNIRFSEFDTGGRLRTRGTAEVARVNTDSNDVELTGSVYLFSESHDASIRSEYLYWDDRAGIISAGEAVRVVLERTDGSIIEGYGFSADTGLNEVVFTRGVQGVMIVDQDKDEQDELEQEAPVE